MRHIAGATFGLCLALAGAAHAQSTSTPAVVVELYTSQGCSSCPLADDFLATLAEDPTIIPLALHVDYWDYIGWKDKFGNPKFTERQRSYARAADSRMIYTPQMVIGGLDRIEGNRIDEVAALIRKHHGVARTVILAVTRDGDTLMIRAEALRAFGSAARVQLVRFKPSETVAIKRGENAGRTVEYHNIVTSWQVIGEWSGAEPLVMEAKAPGSQPAVVIVQAAGPAAILAAARID